MKKILILSAPLLVAILFVMAMASASNAAPGSSLDSVVLALTNSPATSAQTNLPPGIYAAKPYSMTVVVPEPVDKQMVVATNIPESKMPIIKPEIRLEKQ
ncbi:MAG: hypothetical protein WCS94_02905 [Verrucomicrobiota bacterium]